MQQEKGDYTLAVRNDEAVFRNNEGGVFGDPHEPVEVSEGSFTVSAYGGSNWRWAYDYTFVYSEEHKTWILNQQKSLSYHTAQWKEEDGMSEATIRTQDDFGVVRFECFNRTESVE